MFEDPILAVQKLAAIYGRSGIDEVAARAYCNATGFTDREHLCAAFALWLRSSKHFPTPFEIGQIKDMVKMPRAPSVAEAGEV